MDLETATAAWEKISRSSFVASAAGALVSALKFTPGAGWRERMVNAFAGCVAAGYVTPALLAWLGMKSPEYVSMASFMMGLVGMSLAAALMQGIKDAPVGQIIASWLTRKG